MAMILYIINEEEPVMLWEEFSAKEFEGFTKKCGGVCVLPIGVLEKHGDHLPLGTDMYIATEVVKAAAKKAPVMIFPYYYLGQIAEARHVKGTIAPSHRLIMDAMLEMCDEIHRNGFDKILILSGHGGNYHFLPFFAQMFPGINRSYAVYTQFIHDLTEQQLEEIYLSTGVDEMGAHGGFSETALMMFIRPDLVHLDKVIAEEHKDLGRLDSLKDAGIFSGFNWYASYPNHFAGDPTQATKEKGKIIFDILVGNVINLINTVKADDVSLALIREYNEIVDNT